MKIHKINKKKGKCSLSNFAKNTYNKNYPKYFGEYKNFIYQRTHLKDFKQYTLPTYNKNKR